MTRVYKGVKENAAIKILHQTIRKVSDDIRDMKFNTAISQMMVFTNHCYKAGTVNHETAVTFFQLLAPFAPHLGCDFSAELYPYYD